jgi:hypothetical protein
MAKIKIVRKDSAHPIEIETSDGSATRILNRYRLFMQNARQASYTFLLEAPMAGLLSVSFENVLAITPQTDS